MSPNEAIWVATLGLCLIFAELNRPGVILPGSLGLLLFLLAVASLAHYAIQAWAAALLVFSAATLAANLWRRLPLWLLIVATACLVAGQRYLLAGTPNVVGCGTSIVCGVILGAAASILSRIALRARRLKAVN